LQCTPNIFAPQASQTSPEGSGASGACSCCVCSSLTAGVYVRVRAMTPAISAGTRTVFRRRARPEEIHAAGGAQGFERAVGEDLLDLTQRGGEGPGENLQGREALLELGDLDGELLRAGVEGREALLQLAGAPGEAVGLFGEVVPESGARTTEPEVRKDRSHSRHEGERGADEDENSEDSAHREAHGTTRARSFTNR
jgi:hypothetical protein